MLDRLDRIQKPDFFGKVGFLGEARYHILHDDVSAQEVANPIDERGKSLQGSVTRYDDPFEPAIPLSDWDVLQ
jgi:hypothetical protein